MGNKKDFIDKIAEEQGITKTKAKEALGIVLEGLASACRDKEEFQFVGYFTLEKTTKKGRKGKIPQLQKDGTLKDIEWATENREVMKISLSETLK